MTDVVPFVFDKPKLPRPQEYDARVVHSEWLCPDTLRIAFEPTSAPMFAFLPGQYVSVVLAPDEGAGLGRDLRPYSMWNHPDEFEYAVTIVKMVPGGRASTWLRSLKAGDPLRFVGPLGAFFLRRPLHDQLVFVGTGTGIVPLRSMLRDLVGTGEIAGRDITVLFGVRSEVDLFGVAEIERLLRPFPNVKFVPTLSRGSAAWAGARGRVTTHLETMSLDAERSQVYLCGNGAMIDDAVRILESRGLDRRSRRIVLEKYFD